MATFVDYDFTCAICGKDKFTLIDADKLIKMHTTDELIQNILFGYPSSYREIFISRICCKCQESIFGANKEYFDVPIDCTNTDRQKLESKLSEYEENATKQ